MATGVDAKLLKSTRFPPEFSQKVDMQKVNLQVMKKWIASRISEILGNEDDVVIELCYNLIESSRFPDIKGLQIQLTGFLDKETPGFCKELWNLCLSAQASPQGVPKELLEAKKRELMQEKIEAEKAAEERQKREAQSFRGRGDGRSDSYRGGGRGRGRGGGFGDRDMSDRRGGFNRGRDGSRSPPPRGGAGGDSYRAPRRDIYVPRGRRNSMGRRGDTKRRSPSRSPSVNSGTSRSRTRSASSASSDRSPSRSRSPPPRRDQRGSRYRGLRKRSRSPRRSYRPRRRSSSVASVSRSRSPKRRRRASSRSRERQNLHAHAHACAAGAEAGAVVHRVARMANPGGAARGEDDHQRAVQARQVHEVAVAGGGAMVHVASAKIVAAAALIVTTVVTEAQVETGARIVIDPTHAIGERGRIGRDAKAPRFHHQENHETNQLMDPATKTDQHHSHALASQNLPPASQARPRSALRFSEPVVMEG
ncbi:uncharacterized protein PgNI_04874 [Pyricularia grisea]|uniref:PWI domain-containing protein n=1 Tax=Pyricularia grisea TaxID=148305 RepID=A0A6P8BA89_PYRGI|nr:uncharacterized protein PgNI_04874 [Pyricularia grisea]TLD12741.1 hypothetical protein PgNI_04874 [Pyricularia grisea]